MGGREKRRDTAAAQGWMTTTINELYLSHAQAYFATATAFLFFGYDVGLSWGSTTPTPYTIASSGTASIQS